jgi:hypothetical protein
MCFPTAIAVRNHLGFDRIREYNHKLAVAVGETVARIWNTQVLMADTEKYAFMVDVRLPTDDEHLIQNCVFGNSDF